MVDTIEGHAAIWYQPGNRDTEYALWENAVERIARGAFDHALADNDGEEIVCLVNHDPSLVLARLAPSNPTLFLTTDSRGLRYVAELPDTQLARDTVENIRHGVLRGSSFAFGVLSESWAVDGTTSVRTINSVRLYDVSAVTSPAFKGTAAKDVALKVGHRSLELSTKLRGYAQTAARLKMETRMRTTETKTKGTPEAADVRRDGRKREILGEAMRLLRDRIAGINREMRSASSIRRSQLENELLDAERDQRGLKAVIELEQGRG